MYDLMISDLHFQIVELSNCYSVLKLFIGFVIAAFIAWKLMVISAIKITAMPANINIHTLIFIL